MVFYLTLIYKNHYYKMKVKKVIMNFILTFYVLQLSHHLLQGLTKIFFSIKQIAIKHEPVLITNQFARS